MSKHSSKITIISLICVMSWSSIIHAETYSYDIVGRLTEVAYTDGSSISYAYDANGSRVGSTVTVNQAPVANNDSSTTAFDTEVDIDVLANDTDSNGTLDATSVTIIDNATNGTTSVNATNGLVTYSPAVGYSGPDSFTYRVNDNLGATSNLATVSITVEVEPPNQVPVANNDSISTNFNTAVVITVLGNDSDSDGTLNAATVAIGTAPQNGATTIAVNGQITYTPTTGFSGADSFTYTVMDDDGATSNLATVSITVNAMPPPPPPSRSSGGGGSMGGGLFLLILIGLVRRHIHKRESISC